MKYTKAPVAQLPVSRQVETPACRQGASDFRLEGWGGRVPPGVGKRGILKGV